MAKLKIKNGEIVNFLTKELSEFSSEKLSFALRFKLSKIQEEVNNAVKLIQEECVKMQVASPDKVKNDKGEEIEVLTAESATEINNFLSEEIELSYDPLKIKELGEMETDKSYFYIFKFFV